MCVCVCVLVHMHTCENFWSVFGTILFKCWSPDFETGLSLGSGPVAEAQNQVHYVAFSSELWGLNSCFCASTHQLSHTHTSKLLFSLNTELWADGFFLSPCRALSMLFHRLLSSWLTTMLSASVIDCACQLTAVHQLYRAGIFGV